VEKALVEQIPKVMPIAGFIKLTQLRGCPYWNGTLSNSDSALL
jgi:hypothetical protein